MAETSEKTISVSVCGQSLFLAGQHESYLDELAGTDWGDHRLLKLAETLPPGAVFLDVGANIGAMALAVALSRPDVHVFAFEPVPENASLCARNIRQNRVRNCVLVQAAVGDRCGHVTLSNNGPWSSVWPVGVTVPVTTLDRFSADRHLGREVKLIKIDVEGFEPQVLAGASALLRQCEPTLFLEFNSWTLLVQDHNPIRFACELLSKFEVEGPGGGANFPMALRWPTPTWSSPGACSTLH